MPYTVISQCEKCDGSDQFLIGDWKEHLGVYICRPCRAVVNVPLDTRQCPGCGADVVPEQCYDYAHSIPYMNGQFLVQPEPGPICPKCGEGRLSFRPTIHHNMGYVAFRRGDAKRWLGQEYLEKEIFGATLMCVCFELHLEPDDVFSYFCLDWTPGIIRRMARIAHRGYGMSTAVFFDIRTHLAVQTSGGEEPLCTGQRPRGNGDDSELPAIREIRNLGGTVHWSEETGRAESVRFYDDTCDADLVRIKGLVAQLVGPLALTLAKTQISDDGLAHLKDLGNVEELYLLQTRIGDQGLSHLKEMKNLRGCEKSVEQLSQLFRLPSNWDNCSTLRVLRLWGNEVSDVGLAHLRELAGLTDLCLAHTVSGAHANHRRGT